MSSVLNENLEFCSPSGQELDRNINLVWGSSALADYSNKTFLSKPPNAVLSEEAFLSFGLKDKSDKIIAQAAISLHPWGEAELGGAVVLPSFRGQGLMSKINKRRAKDLLKIERAGYRITTYATVGTPAMLYAGKLLSFQNFIGRPMNLAPFVIPGKIKKLVQNISHLYPKKFSIFIYKNKVSTAQFVAVNAIKPFKYRTKIKSLPGEKYLSQLPLISEIEKAKFEESRFTPLPGFNVINAGTNTLLNYLIPKIESDETYLIRVPLIPAFDIFQKKLLKSKTIITGFAVAKDNHLSLVHAKLSKDKQNAFQNLIGELAKSESQIGELAKALIPRAN